MDYNYDPSKNDEYNECALRAICSIDPALSAIQEIILLHLKELAFYLLELEKIGAFNNELKHTFLDYLSIIVVNSTLNQEQYKNTVYSLDKNISLVKKKYIDECEKNNRSPHFLKTSFKHIKDLSLLEGIKKGEKYIKKRAAFLTSEQKNLFDILLALLKSIYIRTFELNDLEDSKNHSFAILSILNSMNFLDTSVEKIKEQIENTAPIFSETLSRLIKIKEKKYGKMTLSDVSFSTRPGKAIMVVGCNIKELESVLEATKDRGVDVYTHGLDMLMAHSFPKFKEYKHLIGHFGQWCDNSLYDYVTFPGSILMTRHSIQKTDYLYRGRLFTTDLIEPKGVIKLPEKNYEQLIQAALSAKGFKKGQQRPSGKIGFSEEKFSLKISEIMDNIEVGKIKHLYVIGLLNHEGEHKNYFDKFFELLPKDCFAICISEERCGKNIFHIDSIFDYALAIRLLENLSKRKPINEFNMSVFLTTCNRHTIATVLSFKKIGVKNIYMSKCQPNIANPSLIECLKNNFEIKEFFDPEEDIKKTMSEDIQDSRNKEEL